MDAYDASKMILTRIQSLDPENASKIMGYILIQDLGDKELIRLAHGPETHLVSLINKAKSFLGFSPNLSPRIMVPNGENNNGFHNTHHHGHLNSSPSMCSSPSSPWSNGSNGFPAFSRKTPISASYAAVVNAGGGSTQSHANIACGSSQTSSLSLSMNMNNSSVNLGNNEEFHGNFHIQDQLSPIMSPSGLSDSVIWNYDDHSAPHPNPFHRRSCSVNDAYLFEDGEGGGQNSNFLGGWRPCMYYARGFCKNGSSCKFSHTFDAATAADLSLVGSPNNLDGFDWLRLKAIQQQRFAAASELMASSPRNSFPYKRSSVAALMGEEFQKFGPCGPDMNNFPGMGLDCNSSSRQIYLTFPADSAFTEEDVSNYFSIYGPVQDVRIPYQQKRMFGFVTFVYAETVYLILAKGNPHFVCDSRVLVKPYKEKGKVVEKKRQQLLERGESPPCPTGFDGREPYDFPFGGRTFYNAKEMMLKNKLEEQAELQQAIELQGRRLLNMRMMDLKNNFNHQSRPSFPLAFPLTSRLQTNPQMFQNISQPSDGVDVEVQEVYPTGVDIGDTPPNVVNEKDTKEASVTSDENNGCEDGSKEAKVILEEADLQERFEHILPDNLFTSPPKTVTEQRYFPERVPAATDANSSTIIASSNYNTVLTPASMTLGAAESAQSCHFQMPRFPSGQGVVEM
ncbi:RNA metabolism protein [Lithospermum erythrorhizon]|uniref:RNA metabolism protein n=1 Tax=Lithospermum erythrorhizon TaxID=34254 RepID=A0AAV3NUE3_LITER